MIYLEAISKAFGFSFLLMGFVFFTLSLWSRNSAMADYCLYVAIVASISGPIGVLIDKSRKTK